MVPSQSFFFYSFCFFSIFQSFFCFFSSPHVLFFTWLSLAAFLPAEPLRRRHEPLRGLPHPSPRRLPQRSHGIDLRLREAPRGIAREREASAAAEAEADLGPGRAGPAEARGREGGVEVAGGGGSGGGQLVGFLLLASRLSRRQRDRGKKRRRRRRSGALCSAISPRCCRCCCCDCDFLAFFRLLPRDCDRVGRGEQRSLGVRSGEKVDVETRRGRGRRRGRRRRRRRGKERTRPALLQRRRRRRPSSSSSSSSTSSSQQLLAQLQGPPLDVPRGVEDEKALEARLRAPSIFFIFF